ncbi:MAG TPA: GAF domain-containing protein, partial [Burkholderiales bacterium]
MASTLRDARAQQAATAEILRAMARARGNPQPVFDAIVRSSVKLCKGAFGALFTYDGKMMGLGAQVQPDRKVREMFRRAFPQPITPTTPSAIAILERRVVNERDMLKAGYAADVVARARAGRYRSVLTVPMMRGKTPIGAIAVTRPQAVPFDDSHVALLKTFAAQAVIAIENARLFNETKEALEQQTATAEILKVISGSPTDTQPVFEAIVRSAAQLFAPCSAGIVMRGGAKLHLRAAAGSNVDQDVRDDLAKL